MEEEWEGLLLLEWPVEVSFNVVNFGLHACVRAHEQVRVAFEQVSQICVRQSLAICFDQREFLVDQISSILQGKLREVIENLYDLRCLDVVIPF